MSFLAKLISKNPYLLNIEPELASVDKFDQILHKKLHNEDSPIIKAKKKADQMKQEQKEDDSKSKSRVRLRVWQMIKEGGTQAEYLEKYKGEKPPSRLKSEWQKYYPEYIRINKRNIFIVLS